MKICLYSAKGGEGKTPIATNIALDREYAIGTNEHFQLFDTFIPDDRLLALEPNEVFPEIPDNVDIVFDLAGSITGNSASIVSALKQADLVIVPITNEVKAIYGGIGTIREILRFCSNVLAVVTKLDKERKDSFNKNEWDKSLAFLNVQAQIHETKGLENIPCLPLKSSKAFDAIFEKELSIAQLMERDPLLRYSFAEVSRQFDEIYKYIDGVENNARKEQRIPA